MLQNAYFPAKIGADTAENEQHVAEILKKSTLRVALELLPRTAEEVDRLDARHDADEGVRVERLRDADLANVIPPRNRQARADSNRWEPFSQTTYPNPLHCHFCSVYQPFAQNR